MMAASCDNSEKIESTAFNAVLELMLSDSVPVISVGELSRIRDDVTILDTRQAEEYTVSRIKGSIHVGFDDFDLSNMDQIPKDRPIIVYCSVGYRSEKVGKKLISAGYTNVRNLYGGIFEWVNQQQTVINDDGPVNKIHPYSMFWSTWITADFITVTQPD